MNTLGAFRVKNLKTAARNNRVPTIVLTIIGVAVLGTTLMHFAKASTPSISFEAEASTIASPAAIVSDAKASGGAAIEFNSPLPPPGKISKVLWIMEENRSEQQVTTDKTTPYIHSLIANYGLLANLHNETDPSEGNYFALLAGNTYNVADDLPPSSHKLSGPTIFSQLPAGQAMTFSETLPSNCDPNDGPKTDVNHAGTYAVHHSGWPYFTDANEHSLCQQYMVDLQSNLPAKLSSGLPSFTEVAPANCNEMHHGSLPASSDICKFDATTGPDLYTRADWWLSVWIPKIMAGTDYKAGRLAIMIIWDEGAGPGDVAGMDCTNSTLEACHPTGIVISPYTHSVVSNTHYTHYDVLRTTEELLGLHTYLGHAAQGTSFASQFGLN